MNRRSILKLLGLAPVAAPAVAAATSDDACRGALVQISRAVETLPRVPVPTDAASWMYYSRRAVAPDGSEWIITPDGRAWEADRPA